MEEQQSREFASADAAARAQDAAVQEPGFSPEISFHTRRRLQHLQRPTPSHLGPNAPRTSRCRDDHVADCSRSGLTIHEALTLRARRTGNMTKPYWPVTPSRVQAGPPKREIQLFGGPPFGAGSRHTYQSRLGADRDERLSRNQGWRSEVWFGT